jgi:pilus assembly protein Flp/PilA
MRNLIKKLKNDTKGATAIEYGLIAGLIAVVIVAAATTLGTNVSSLFGAVNGKVTAATPAS